MALEKVITVSGTGVHVPGSDIDTDRIIPARFMKCVTFDGLGEYFFYDVRFNEDGSEEKPHPLNDPRFKGASILLSGINFGCGSSREHAPQAAYRFGIRAIIAQSFAEIFFGNCVTLGVPCVIATPDQIQTLSAAIETDPSLEITVDVEKKEVRYGDSSFPIEVADTAREAFLSAKWDPIADLVDGETAIEKTASALPYMAS